MLRARSQEGKGDSSLRVTVPFRQNHFKLQLIKCGWERGEEETHQETMAVVQAGLSEARRSGWGRKSQLDLRGPIRSRSTSA